MNPLLRQLLSYARRAGNFFAPRNVGVHHTFYGAGPDANWMPRWNTPFVRPSTVPTGQLGVTAGDQIPGMSYYWSAGGRGGADEAANLARGQTALQFERAILEPGTQGVAKITTTPRFGPLADPNLPGTRARMIPGPTSQRVVGEVVSPAGPLSEAAEREVARLVRQQRAREAARSTARISAAVAAARAAEAERGFWSSVWESFLGGMDENERRREAQWDAGNRLGAVGSYLGGLAQGPQGMAVSAMLDPGLTRSEEAQASRYQAQADAPARVTPPPPPPSPRPAPRPAPAPPPVVRRASAPIRKATAPRRVGGGTNTFM